MGKLLSSVAAAALAASVFISGPASATVAYTDDPILYWNQVMYSNAFPGGPPQQSRAAAMVNVAMYNAVVAANANGGDLRAAASQAAHDVLVALNPGQTATYNAALSQSLSLVSNPTALSNGTSWGSAYATATIGNRATDGAAGAGAVSYTPGTDPGDWQPTPPGNLPAALPGWGQVTPFSMTSGTQFVPTSGPPALDSAAYAAAYNQVMDIGSLTSATRTADQTQAALFWNQAGGFTWIQIGTNAAADNGLSTLQLAEVFARLGVGLADAFITGFATKYEYNFWRPITAIHEGDFDGNPDTTGDALWTSLINAPNHPSYLSTHSIASGVSSTILAALLGNEAFCETFTGAGGTYSRCFNSFTDAAVDGEMSRIWGGIHFSFDGEAGLAAGQQIAQFELGQSVFNPVPEPSTWAMLLAGFGAIGVALRRRRKAYRARAAEPTLA